MHPHAMVRNTPFEALSRMTDIRQMKVGRVAAISRAFSLLIFSSSSGRTESAAAGIFSVRSAARGRISRGFCHVRAIPVTWHGTVASSQLISDPHVVVFGSLRSSNFLAVIRDVNARPRARTKKTHCELLPSFFLPLPFFEETLLWPLVSIRGKSPSNTALCSWPLPLVSGEVPLELPP